MKACKSLIYSIVLLGCFVRIKNGNSGTFDIDKSTIAIDGCLDELSVLCDSSDNSDYITVLDLSKKRTAFLPKVTSLYWKNFGFSTRDELLAELSSLIGRDIVPNCCISENNDLKEAVYVDTDYASLSVSAVLPAPILPFDVYTLQFFDGVFGHPTVVVTLPSPVTVNSTVEFVALWNAHMTELTLSNRDNNTFWIESNNLPTGLGGLRMTLQAGALPVVNYPTTVWTLGSKQAMVDKKVICNKP